MFIYAFMSKVEIFGSLVGIPFPWHCQFHYVFPIVKFMYSKKATKFCEIFPLLLTVCTVVKSKGKTSQNFVAFSEYMNFNNSPFVLVLEVEVLWLDWVPAKAVLIYCFVYFRRRYDFRFRLPLLSPCPWESIQDLNFRLTVQEEILIFFISLTKIINRAYKNWAYFRK